MTANAQGQSASELSASLVRDYRAIITSLEQNKAEGPQLPPAALDEPSESPRERADRAMAQPVIRSTRPKASGAAAASRPVPLGFAELRSRLAALGDTRNILAPRQPAEAPKAPAAPVEAAETPAARRRMFGGVARTEAEPAAARRKRSASGEAFTWQRLGVLAICITAIGGAAVALQSVVGRDEARVAPEVIGNAAIASVAPSAPTPATTPPVVETVDIAANAPMAASAVAPAAPATPPAPVVPQISARALLAPPPSEPPVRGLTAFAAQEPSMLPATAPEITLPRQAPLPPKRAVAAAPVPEIVDAADTANRPSAVSGGDPIGGATIRSAVTMRTGPRKGAPAMATLKGGQQVELVSCDSWCEIVADGKRGFIYKSYLNAGARKEADATPETSTE